MSKNISIIMILGVSLMVASMANTVSAEESIGIFSLQSEIVKTDDIRITGFVNTESFYKPVKLQVYDPNGNLVYMPNVQFDDDGQFSWLIHPPLGKYKIMGTYTIVASHEDIAETAKIEYTVTDNTNSNNTWLQTIMMDSNSFEEINSQNKILEIQQETTQKEGTVLIQQQNTEQNVPTQSSPKVNSNPVISEQTDMISNIQEDLSAQQVQTTSNEFIKTIESPLAMTAIAVTIAGVIAGIVIWMRQTYERPMVQK